LTEEDKEEQAGEVRRGCDNPNSGFECAARVLCN
jgi:hypothetical protein